MVNRQSKPYKPKGFSGDEVEVLFLEIVIKNNWTTEIMGANNIFMSLLEERGGITSASYNIVTHIITGTSEFPVDTSYIEGLRPGGRYHDELYKILKKTNPKIVAMNLMTPMYNRGVIIAKAIKEYDTNIKVIVGGIHPTVFPEQTLKDGFDHVFIGDGFQTLAPTIEDILMQRETDKIIVADKPFVDNPDDLPFAHPNAYENRKLVNFGTTKTILFASYGCNSNCKFCGGGSLYKMGRRTHDPERIVDEMEWQIEQYGEKYLKENGKSSFFFGDASTVQDAAEDLKRMLTIITKIEERGLEVLMDFELRADVIREISEKKPDELERLYQYSDSVVFGVESLRDTTLQKYKSESLKDVVGAIKAMKNHLNSKLPTVFFIIGYECDTRETIIEDIILLRQLVGENAIIPIFILTPDPGSRLYYEFNEKGKIRIRNWDYYTHRKLVWDHPNLESNELETLYHQIRKDYGIPNWIKDLKKEVV